MSRSSEPPPAGLPSKAAVVAGAMLSAPLIAVLHHPALAIGQSSEEGGIGGPMLDPPTMIAAGAAIASIGAYRLMKLRGRKPPAEKGSVDE